MPAGWDGVRFVRRVAGRPLWGPRACPRREGSPGAAVLLAAPGRGADLGPNVDTTAVRTLQRELLGPVPCFSRHVVNLMIQSLRNPLLGRHFQALSMLKYLNVSVFESIIYFCLLNPQLIGLVQVTGRRINSDYLQCVICCVKSRTLSHVILTVTV